MRGKKEREKMRYPKEREERKLKKRKGKLIIKFLLKSTAAISSLQH